MKKNRGALVPFADRLGVLPDRDVARLAGATVQAVGQARRKLGLAPVTGAAAGLPGWKAPKRAKPAIKHRDAALLGEAVHRLADATPERRREVLDVLKRES